MHMFHTKCKASRVWSTLQLNVFWGVKHWCFLCWLAWKFLLGRKQSQLITEIHIISKKKGKRLLNKLVYFQSLSNRALYFKIKAKPAKHSLWMAKKRVSWRKKNPPKHKITPQEALFSWWGSRRPDPMQWITDLQHRRVLHLQQTGTGADSLSKLGYKFGMLRFWIPMRL